MNGKEIKRIIQKLDRYIYSSYIVIDNNITEEIETRRSKGNLAKLSTLKTIERRTRKDKAKLVKKALKGMREQIALAAENDNLCIQPIWCWIDK